MSTTELTYILKLVEGIQKVETFEERGKAKNLYLFYFVMLQMCQEEACHFMVVQLQLHCLKLKKSKVSLQKSF